LMHLLHTPKKKKFFLEVIHNSWNASYTGDIEQHLFFPELI
jgi:hypothetical protein